MRRTKRNKKQIFVGIISSIVLALTIGYSFLSLNLRISGLAHIGAVWNIHFDNITINPDSVSLSVGDIEPEIDDDNDCKINYKVTLTPGDFYEFTFDIVNDGTIDGMIQNMITRIEEDATATFPSYIDYTVSYSDDVVLETNQQLLKGTTETLKVKLEFKDEENVPQSETLDLSYENNYIKKTNSSTVVKHPQPLYDVLKNEYDSGSGHVLKYTGSHHDSFTEEPSKDIYHWYAPSSSSSQATTIYNKNNILFAGFCWKILRTTDTGGIKVVYNGDASNNQCLGSSSFGFRSWGLSTGGGTLWYGTDFNYNKETKKFTLAGNTEEVYLSPTNYSSNSNALIQDKYTCLSTDVDASCSTIYYVLSRYDAPHIKTIPITNSINNSSIGILPFDNSGYQNLTIVGYMHAQNRTIQDINRIRTSSISSTNYLFKSIYQNPYYVSDTIDYGNQVNDEYSLINPTLISSSNYQDFIGKYTFFKSNSSYTHNSIYYVVGLKSSILYYVELKNGQISPNSILYGDSLSDNLDGTYTIDDYDTISLINYFNNNENIKNKYVCPDNSRTCSNPRFLINTSNTYYSYIDSSAKILLAKERNGLVLSDTLVLRKDELIKNRNNYSAYKYSCGNTDSICTNDNLIMIDSISDSGYTYASNYIWGSSVTWDGSNYTLDNPIEIEHYNDYSSLGNHHYVCDSLGATTCSKVYYYYSTGDTMKALILENGTTTIYQVLDDILKNNSIDSTMKWGIDLWYQKNLLDYSNYIEDTIFCNDRSFNTTVGKTFEESSWNPNGSYNSSSNLFFKNNTNNTDLSCSNITDKFSVSNSQAQLTYKVGILTSPEVKLIDNITILFNEGNKWFWTMSPDRYENGKAYEIFTTRGVVGGSNTPEYERETYPTISLKPGTMYTDGDGSREHPYIIKTN